MSGKFVVPNAPDAINSLKKRVRIVEQRIQRLQPVCDNFEVIASGNVAAPCLSPPWTPWGPCTLIELFVELAPGSASGDTSFQVRNLGNTIALVTMGSGTASAKTTCQVPLGIADQLALFTDGAGVNGMITMHARFKGAPQMSGGLILIAQGD